VFSGRPKVVTLLVFGLVSTLLLAGCQTDGQSSPGEASQAQAQVSVESPSPLAFPEEAREGFSEIVYTGPNGNILTMDRNGENQVPVTTQEGPISVDQFVFSLPRLSADGSKVAFMGHDRAGSENRIRNIIYVADAEAGEIVPVHSSMADAPFFMDFSPTGESLAIVSSVSETGKLALQRVDVDGSDFRVIAEGRPLYYDWAETGNAIATHIGGSALEDSASGSSNGTIGIIDMAGSANQSVLDQLPTYFQVPAFSPDGSVIAGAVVSPEGESSISLFDPRGDHVETLANIDGFAAMDWSPDGRRLAYIDGSNNPFSGIVGTLHVRNLQAVQQSISMQSGQGDSAYTVDRVAAFFWSPDGEKIALFRPVPVGGSQGNTSGMNRYFRVTVLFVESGETVNYGVFPASIKFVSRVIPHFDQYHRSVQVWSPDSSNIVINSISDGQRPAVYLIDLENRGNPQKIASGDMAFFAPSGP
jgi:Tol biopolymer transport system component